MKTILVVDDERTFDMDAVHVRTSAWALYALAIGTPLDELWLDHDLGGEDKGMIVADWLCEEAFNGRPYPVKSIFVHSMNPGASDDMVRTLARYGYNVKRVPLPAMVG